MDFFAAGPFFGVLAAAFFEEPEIGLLFDLFDLAEVLVDVELAFAAFFTLVDTTLADAEFVDFFDLDDAVLALLVDFFSLVEAELDFAADFFDAVGFLVVFLSVFSVVLSVKLILLTGRPVLKLLA
ncbi:MAG: hypothetical protein V3U32_08310 [Anaerolineales bacterium]